MILIKGIAPKEIDNKAFSLAVGKVSDPIKTDLGYHIIKIKEKRAEKDFGYDDIAKDLAQYLAQQKIQNAMGDYIGELYDKADVKVTISFESDKLIEEALAQQAQAAQKADKKEVKSEKKADKKEAKEEKKEEKK